MQLAVEGTRAALIEAALERLREVVERLTGDPRQVELARLFQRRPDEVDELGLRMRCSLDALGDEPRVDDEKARVEAPRPSRRRDRSGEKVDVVERRIDAGRGEPLPCAGRRILGRAIIA